MGNELVSTNGAQAAAGMVASRALGEMSLEVRAETASMAVAAQAAAVVRARYAMALERPRDVMVVRERLLNALKRSRFAETARYAKPVGNQKIRGWTIRFAEEVARAMTNVLIETMVVYENQRQRIIRVSVTDLESNLPYTTDVMVDKTVERHNPTGYEVIGTRINKSGKTVHIVAATDDDLQNKQGALVSKALRNSLLRLVPGDVLEDCLDAYEAAMNGQTHDPKAAIKGLVDGFAGIGVSVEELAEYLGRPLDKMTRQEHAELRQIGIAIKDGETTWAAVMAQAEEERAAKKDEAEAPIDKPAEGAGEAAAAPAPTSPKEPVRNLVDLKKREKGKTPPTQKVIDIKVEGDDGKKRPVVDPEDTGPCGFELSAETGEVCMHEGPKVIGVGYRCGKHQPGEAA